VASPQAGWYPDPYAGKDSGVLRWFDGSAWTQDVRRPQVPARAARPASARVSGDVATQASDATWDSIPQPGTTYTVDALNIPPPRIRVLPLAVLLLAIIALIAFATQGS
jgi:hypothetical protein